MHLRSILFSILCVAGIGMAGAAPYVPQADDVVLERLPEKTEPSLKQLKAMRAALARNRDDLDLATRVARRAIEASRADGDPRFLGQAQAALEPWWTLRPPPPQVLVLRATIRQSQHDFDGALADLDELLRAHPADGQALLTRATVLSVRGRYAEARADCARLAGRTSALVVTTCDAGPASLSGEGPRAAQALESALQRQGEDAAVREWAATLAAEIAARNGDAAAAERHFRAALSLDPHDAYLKAAYADFLLEAGRPREALPLVQGDLRNDTLLLRVALAEQAIPERHADFVAHRDELSARFDAARRRGDSLHRREEARFRLTMMGDPAGALALARANWEVQREPADLRILADAARAVGDAASLRMVEAWIDQTGLRDVQIAAAGTPR